eukprot:4555233-Pleurochrysis_carterae.AAC.1
MHVCTCITAPVKAPPPLAHVFQRARAVQVRLKEQYTYRCRRRYIHAVERRSERSVTTRRSESTHGSSSDGEVEADSGDGASKVESSAGDDADDDDETAFQRCACMRACVWLRA